MRKSCNLMKDLYLCLILAHQMPRRLLHSLLFSCTALLLWAGSWGFARVAEAMDRQGEETSRLYASDDAARFAREMSGELRDSAAWNPILGQQNASKAPRPVFSWAGMAGAEPKTSLPVRCGHRLAARCPGCGQGLFPGVHLISLRI